MATPDVPGSNPVNNDKLARGAWAEHEDGSLIFVKDIDENDVVVFEIYDLANAAHPVYYPQALALREFEKTFSYNPKKKGKTNIKWSWHDKSAFPWERVMKVISTPVPVSANVIDTLSAAARIAESLKVKVSKTVTEDHVRYAQGLEVRSGITQAKGIFQRLKNAVSALVD